jgi:hypothetical protein
LLKLQLYAQHSVACRPFPKLAFKCFGPFEIFDKIGAMAYKLKLPTGNLIHLVFHVSQLKEFTPDHTPVYSQLPDIPSLDIVDVLPETILVRRLVKKGNEAVTQILVRWTSLPDTSTTWEDYYVMKERFPRAPVWNSVASSMGGTVTGQAPVLNEA